MAKLNPCTVIENGSIVSGMPAIKGGPFPQDVTMQLVSPYGPRDPIYTPNGTTANFHFGADFWSPEAPPPLVAMTDGVVTYSVSGDSMVGNWIQVQNDQYSWEYYHLSAPSGLNVGDTVIPGQYVGNVGATGMATGPHLHLGIKHNGSTVDPMPFLTGGTGVSVTPEFRPAPSNVKYSPDNTALVVFIGGTIKDLEQLSRDAGAKGVWVQDQGGVFRLYSLDGPDFINKDFVEAFPTTFGTCAVNLVRKDS
mgnify:CR=1 FL=1